MGNPYLNYQKLLKVTDNKTETIYLCVYLVTLVVLAFASTQRRFLR